MKKFFDFFKTTLGIVIIIVVVIAIILIAMNWDSIKLWWASQSAPDTATGTNANNAVDNQGRTVNPGGSTAKQACIMIGGDGCSYQGLYVPCSECTKRGIEVKA